MCAQGIESVEEGGREVRGCLKFKKVNYENILIAHWHFGLLWDANSMPTTITTTTTTTTLGQFSSSQMHFDTKLTFNKLASHVETATATTFKTSAYKTRPVDSRQQRKHQQQRQQVRQCDATTTKMVSTLGEQLPIGSCQLASLPAGSSILPTRSGHMCCRCL